MQNSEALITIHGEWKSDGIEERERYWHYVCLYTPEGYRIEPSEPEAQEEATNLRRAYSAILDTAYVMGYRRATVCMRLGTGSSETRFTLRGNARRRQLVAEYQHRQESLRRRRHREQIRGRCYQRLAGTLGTNPDSRSIRQFFRAWEKVRGYGNKNDTLRSLLAPAKIAW